MNNKTFLAIACLLAGTLLSGTSTMAMVPAYAGGDDDDDHKGGDGNKQKVEDESAGAIADCDKNEVERADFDCIASSATEDSEVSTDGDGDDNGDGNGDDPQDEECPPGFTPFEIGSGVVLCLPDTIGI
jgi:hypothetical protein